MTFDWNASYEWLAEEFRKETGLMAPAKDDPLGSDMAERRNAWSKWFESRNEEAWREWHERHGMLAAHSAGAQTEQMTDAAQPSQPALSDDMLCVIVTEARRAGNYQEAFERAKRKLERRAEIERIDRAGEE